MLTGRTITIARLELDLRTISFCPHSPLTHAHTHTHTYARTHTHTLTHTHTHVHKHSRTHFATALNLFFLTLAKQKTVSPLNIFI